MLVKELHWNGERISEVECFCIVTTESDPAVALANQTAEPGNFFQVGSRYYLPTRFGYRITNKLNILRDLKRKEDRQ